MNKNDENASDSTQLSNTCRMSSLGELASVFIMSFDCTCFLGWSL